MTKDERKESLSILIHWVEDTCHIGPCPIADMIKGTDGWIVLWYPNLLNQPKDANFHKCEAAARSAIESWAQQALSARRAQTEVCR